MTNPRTSEIACIRTLSSCESDKSTESMQKHGSRAYKIDMDG